MTKIPVLMCIDVEPDARLIDPDVRPDWRGFELAFEFFGELRHRLKAATGSPAHFCWFFRMDPQIARTYGSAAWVTKRYSSLIEVLKHAGDAIGLHVHAWRWNEKSSEWVLDFADQNWVDKCVQMGFEAFGESLNEPCRYFRFGDRWMNNATFELMELLGARFDLTLEPRQECGPLDERFTGSLLDYQQVPQYPYLPAKTDFRAPGAASTRRVWEIPLSVGSTDWSPEALREMTLGIVPAHDLSRRNPSPQSGCESRSDAKNGMHEGYLDTVDSTYISGWVYEKEDPDMPLVVEISDGGVPVARVRAATFRSDLLAAGKGNGKHSFNVPVPSWMRDGEPHLIHVRVAATGFNLNNSPQKLTCNRLSPSERYMTMNLSLDTWPLCKIIDRLLSVRKNPYLALVVRSDVCLHADQYSNMEESLSHVLRHPRVGQLAFETPDQLIKGME